MARNFAAGSTDVAVFSSAAATPTTFTYASWVNIGTYRLNNDYRLLTWGIDASIRFAVYQANFNAPPTNDWIGFYAPGWDGTDGEWVMVGPATGTWAHVAMTYDSGSTTNDPVMYLNGTSSTVTEITNPTGTWATGTDDVYLGNQSAGVRGLDGSLAESAVWNRILTAGEILALSKTYSPSHFPRGLVWYSPTIGRYSPEMNLATGGGPTGTVTGTTTVAHPRTLYPRHAQARRFTTEPAAPGGWGKLLNPSRNRLVYA